MAKNKFEKDQAVTYNGVECVITAVNENGTLDLQETKVSGAKDPESGEEIAPRWFHAIDPAAIEGK